MPLAVASPCFRSFEIAAQNSVGTKRWRACAKRRDDRSGGASGTERMAHLDRLRSAEHLDCEHRAK
jgi:hypothetical protein